MKIEIKKSKKPIKYEDAIHFMEKRLNDLHENKGSELIWTLEHDDIYRKTMVSNPFTYTHTNSGYFLNI